MKSQKGIDCNKCTHFFITWDKNLPYGCRAMKFKSKKNPSIAVLESSGIACMLFKRKSNRQRRNPDAGR